MNVSRRRLLNIAASFVAAPALARPHSWSGQAFGAEVSIELNGPAETARGALAEVQGLLATFERQFSLYDPDSELSRLNAAGSHVVSARFQEMMRIADLAHHLTGGLFDPTVQPLWQALATGGNVTAARNLLGWDRVRLRGAHVKLDAGQALTFNGIAQGFATDIIADFLREKGFHRTLVNIGEYRGLGGPWRLGIADPTFGLLATQTLTDAAIATSSPLATPIGPTGHIVHDVYAPRWSTVSVEAKTAAMADALSTGLVLADLDLARQVRATEGVGRITLIDLNGDLTTL